MVWISWTVMLTGVVVRRSARVPLVALVACQVTCQMMVMVPW